MLCRELDIAPALFSTQEVLSVAESIERLSRRGEYAQSAKAPW